jgi:hypothetical protein
MNTFLIIIFFLVIALLIKKRMSVPTGNSQIRNREISSKNTDCEEKFSESVRIARREVEVKMQLDTLKMSREERKFLESISREERNFHKVVKYGEFIIDDMETMIDFAKVSYVLQYRSMKSIDLKLTNKYKSIENTIFSALQCIIKSHQNSPIASCPEFLELVEYRNMLGCQRMHVFYENEIINVEDNCRETNCYVGTKSCYEVMLAHLKEFEYWYKKQVDTVV